MGNHVLNSLALRAAVGRAIGCLLVVATSTNCVAGATAPPGDGIYVPSTVDLAGVPTATTALRATGSLPQELWPGSTEVGGEIPANTETSPTPALGHYEQGHTLHLSVVSIERVPELRYSTIDPKGTVRRWSLTPSAEGMELLLVGTRVENHTQAVVKIDVGGTAVELRDSSGEVHRPISISDAVWRDFRGEPSAVVRIDEGQCFDGARALVTAGSTVKWQNESEGVHLVVFADGSTLLGGDQRGRIPGGETITHTFVQPGSYQYTCSTPGMPLWPSELRVEEPSDDREIYLERSTHFIYGPFDLAEGYGLDGYLVFEAPEGRDFVEMRWLAGDSIAFPL